MAALEQWPVKPSVKNPAPNRRFEVVAEEVLVKAGVKTKNGLPLPISNLLSAKPTFIRYRFIITRISDQKLIRFAVRKLFLDYFPISRPDRPPYFAI